MPDPTPNAVTPNPYAGSRYAMEIDGNPVGPMLSFSGLDWEADIATTVSGTGARKKNVSAVRQTPGRLTMSSIMGQALYGWIRASIDAADNRGGLTRSGSFQVVDFNGKPISAMTFKDARLTEFTVPAMDGSSKEVGHFELAFDTARADWVKPAATAPSPGTFTTKPWISSLFKVEIGSLPCKRVARIESFTWRSTPRSGSGGAEPGRLPASRVDEATVPDITLSISMADYLPWIEAAQRWFVEGRRLEADEMSGRITLLGPSMKDADAVGSIELFGLGFKRFSLPPFTRSDAVARFSVQLYVERMRFVLNGLPG